MLRIRLIGGYGNILVTFVDWGVDICIRKSLKMKNILKKTVVLPVSADCAFAWHEQPGAFTRLIPPWEFVQVKSADGGIQDGAHVVLQTKIGMLPMRWVALHYGYAPGRRFCDLQKRGPFKEWRHIHQFDSISDPIRFDF